MSDDSKYQFVLKCKQCKSRILSPKSHCTKCGISPSFFSKKDHLDKIRSFCTICDAEISYKHIPNICFVCGSSEKDFWDQNSEDWIKREVVFSTHKDAIWLVGDFVGDYIGELISPVNSDQVEDLMRNTRKYDVKIIGGKLENYTLTDTPPNLDFNNSIKPLRQLSIKAILVKVMGADKYIPLDLVDLVIYDWRKISDKEFLEDKKIAGHISGKLCGCLLRQVDDQNGIQVPPEFKIVDVPKVDVPKVDVPKVDVPKLDVPKVDVPKVDVPKVDVPKVSSHTPFRKTSQEPALSSYESSKVVSDNSIKDCIICNNWLQLLITFLIFFIFQADNKTISPAELLICHLRQALIFYLMLKLVCYAREKLLFIFDKYIKERVKIYIGIFLLCVSLISLLILLANSYHIHCFGNAIEEFWPWIIFICFLLSVLLDSCFVRTSLALIFAFTIIFVFSCNEFTCYQIDNTKVQSFKQQMENVKSNSKGLIDDKKQEYLEDKLKEVSSPDSPIDKRVTLNDLKTAPNPLSGCNASLYLGELSFFDRNSSVIKKSAQYKLFKVADLLKGQNKDSTYIITGHADKTGEINKDGKVIPMGFANNMKLSKARAQALADWLISHDVLTSEQVDIRGVGSTEPLVTDSDLKMQEINIRVEVRKNCELIN